MEYVKGKIAKLLTDYFENDFRRINHAFEVLRYAEEVMEKYEDFDYEIVVATALLHDVGIKKSEELHGHNNGRTQEEYGPSIAVSLLSGIDFPEDKMKKVSEIIGNHHSKSRYDYPELAILKEADLIVNGMED